jgi:probable O-glycosylation ligase (exosortase A-associated)
MLRMIFVILLILAGIFFSTQTAFYALLFYLWNAYFRPETWVYYEVIRSLRLSLIIGIYVVLRTMLSMPRLKLNWQTGLIFLFFIQVLIGCFTSEAPDRSWAYFDGFWKVLLISYLIVVLTDDRRKFRLVLLVIVLSLGFETAKQGWANLFRGPGQPNNNPNAFLGDNNGVALGLMMLLPIIGALAQTSGRVWERNVHRFTGIGVLLRGITTYSRGGFLGAGTLMVIGILRSEKKLRAVVVAAVLAAGILVLMPTEFWDRMNTITAGEGEQVDDSAASRIHFWHVAVDMANANPLTGVGFLAFNRAFMSYNTDSGYEGQERAAHSIWFGVLGELGYPGLILFILNLGTAFWSCWRVHRLTKNRPDLRDLRIYANALISALAVYSVSGSFLSHQYNEMAWHMFALTAALRYVTADCLTGVEPRDARLKAA